MEPLLFRQNTFPGRHGGAWQTVRNSLKQIVLTGDGFLGIEQRQLTAGRVPNLERPLVEIAGTRPETIGTGSIASSINPVAPDTLGEVDPLSCFDHVSRRLRC